jgi:hypothetical protein
MLGKGGAFEMVSESDVGGDNCVGGEDWPISSEIDPD